MKIFNNRYSNHLLRFANHFRKFVLELFGNYDYSFKPSLNHLDDRLMKHINYDGGFFIEAGANDGVNQSNTYFLEMSRQWKGLLIEPIPSLYQECKQNRPNSITVNCALSNQDKEGSEIEIFDAGLMSICKGSLGSRKEELEHAKNGLIAHGRNIDSLKKYKIQSFSLSALISDKKISKIDFLSLDVEGHEEQVLKGLMQSPIKPIFILVECRFYEDVWAVLKNHYHVIEKLTYHDYLFKLKNVCIQTS